MSNGFRLANDKDLDCVCLMLVNKFKNTVAKWPEESVRNYVGYYVKSGLCALYEKDSKIKAVVMGRPVSTIDQGVNDRWAIDWKGNILWVECTASECGILNLLIGSVAILEGYGCKLEKIAWNRGDKSDYEPVVMPLDVARERMKAYV